MYKNRFNAKYNTLINDSKSRTIDFIPKNMQMTLFWLQKAKINFMFKMRIILNGYQFLFGTGYDALAHL